MSIYTLLSTPKTNRIITIVVALTVVTAGMGLAVSSGAASAGNLDGLLAQQQQAPETAVSLQPTNATVESQETTTYNVVVENADGGVGAYNFSVAVEDASVASISAIELGGSPSEQTTDVTVAEDNASVHVVAALANTTDTGSVTIGTITVSGDAAGTSDLSLTVEALGTEAGQSYTVTGATDASITVEEAETTTPTPAPTEPPTQTPPETPETPDVTITTEPPNASEMDLDRGTNVTLTADTSNFDGNITAIEWDTDNDGEFDQSGETVTLSLDFCGELLVTVQVTDDSGQSVTESVTLSTVKSNSGE